MKFFSIAFICFMLFPIGCRLYKYSYENSVQQGNVFTQEDLDKITLGMSSDEVIQILGTPIIINIFNDSSLDYVYYLRVSHHMKELKKVSFYFVDKKLDKIK